MLSSTLTTAVDDVGEREQPVLPGALETALALAVPTRTMHHQRAGAAATITLPANPGPTHAVTSGAASSISDPAQSGTTERERQPRALR